MGKPKNRRRGVVVEAATDLESFKAAEEQK